MNPRLSHVDWLKALGIILVVYGHCLAAPKWATHFIYAFHMPLFFFISGYLLKDEKLKLPLRDFARFLSRDLIRPYLFFAAVGYVSWLLVLRHFGNDAGDSIPVGRPLLGILYGSGSRDDLLQPVVLWFFPCLVSAQLLWFFFTKRHRLIPVFLLISAVVGFLFPNLLLPWELETALVAVGFFAAGSFLARWKAHLIILEKLPLPVALVLAVAGYALSRMNSEVDMRTSAYGNPLLFYPSACLILVALFRMTMSLPSLKIVETISKATVSIFPLHPLLFSVFSAVYVFVLKLPLSIREHPMVGLIATAVAVVILTGLHPLVAWVVLAKKSCKQGAGMK